jgi:two-component system NtrC family sensor kinase
MQNMGGRITVESKVGRGTTFSVCLPLSKAETSRIYFVRAKNEREIEDVFFLQRKILIGEKGYLEETIRREMDEKAYHLLAYKGLNPVGTVSCVTERIAHNLPIEEHFDLHKFKKGKRCVEINRLAVLKEERGSIIPLGLMTLAYLFAKSENAERVFLDVFSDEKKYISMYRKLGFQEAGSYRWLLPVTVMMMDRRTDYEKKVQRMEQFVKPFITRLMKRIELDEEDRQKILKAVEILIEQSPPEYKETLESH